MVSCSSFDAVMARSLASVRVRAGCFLVIMMGPTVSLLVCNGNGPLTECFQWWFFGSRPFWKV